MQANRSRDTSIELELRHELYARGLRYRTHYRPIVGLRCTADIAFTRRRIAVFVDGCWWHGCPSHWSPPKANREWWIHKMEINTARDRRNDSVLRAAGWTVVRVWEHESPADAADRIEGLYTVSAGPSI